MNYTHKVDNEVDVVELRESIDLYSVPIIKKFIKTLLHKEDRKIIIVFSKVTFIDSSGLGMIVNLFFECKQKRIKIKFAEMSKEAERVFTITKLINNYEIFKTYEEALHSLTIS